MNILLKLNPGIGEDLGPDFLITCDVIGWSETATDIELYAGISIVVPDEATVIYIQSLGICLNILTIPIEPFVCTLEVEMITTTTTTSTSTSTSTTSTTTTTTTYIPDCNLEGDIEVINEFSPDVFFVTASTPALIKRYNVATQDSVDLFTAPYQSSDIAMTFNKMWINNFIGNEVKEYDITIDPWSQVFVRTITNIPASPGLGIINNTTLIGINGTNLYECDITTTTSVNTLKFSLISGRTVSGDVYLTTTGKLIITTYKNTGAPTNYITQYDYASGDVEVDIPFSSALNGYGLFQFENELYIASSDRIYHVAKSSPYTMTLINFPGYYINGSTQTPNYLTSQFTP